MHKGMWVITGFLRDKSYRMQPTHSVAFELTSKN